MKENADSRAADRNGPLCPGLPYIGPTARGLASARAPNERGVGKNRQFSANKSEPIP